MTAKILELSLDPTRVTTVIDRHFSSKRNPELEPILDDEESRNQTLLLYPGPEAVPIEEVDLSAGPFNVLLLDGTWPQAKSMFLKSPTLQNLKRVAIVAKHKSEYLVRTQPSAECLSTVESAAIVLAHLERDETIIESLLKPLRALVGYQIDLGAKVHDNKEEAILKGTYHKKISKKIMEHVRCNKSIKALLL